ncbi:MAG: hypothetical protein NTU58_04330 [Candidatus Nealsonbacteria bacterium]|nr:hypothetical protein [Candidatus Nealsonbacteria bacterium]
MDILYVIVGIILVYIIAFVIIRTKALDIWDAVMVLTLLSDIAFLVIMAGFLVVIFFLSFPVPTLIIILLLSVLVLRKHLIKTIQLFKKTITL